VIHTLLFTIITTVACRALGRPTCALIHGGWPQMSLLRRYHPTNGHFCSSLNLNDLQFLQIWEVRELNSGQNTLCKTNGAVKTSSILKMWKTSTSVRYVGPVGPVGPGSRMAKAWCGTEPIRPCGTPRCEATTVWKGGKSPEIDKKIYLGVQQLFLIQGLLDHFQFMVNVCAWSITKSWIQSSDPAHN